MCKLVVPNIGTSNNLLATLYLPVLMHLGVGYTLTKKYWPISNIHFHNFPKPQSIIFHENKYFDAFNFTRAPLQFY